MKNKKYIILFVAVFSVLFMGCSKQHGTETDVASNLEPTVTGVLEPTESVEEKGVTEFELAVEAFEKMNYEEAFAHFELATESYSKKAEYLKKIAYHYIEIGELTLAQQVIDRIDKHDYASARDIQISMKYCMYETDKFSLYEAYDLGPITYNNDGQMESLLSQVYGTWYHADTDDEQMVITNIKINGRPYIIRTLYEFLEDSGVQFYFSYTDELDKIYGYNYDIEILETADTTYLLSRLSDPCQDGAEEVDTYYSEDKETRYAYWDANEAYYTEQVTQSVQSKNKSNAYSAAKNVFKSKYIDKVYTPVEQIYVSTKYQDEGSIGFSYDSSMDTYNIRFEVAVSDNFGVTWNNFIVQVQFYNAGNGRYEVSMFNIY